MLYFRTLGEIDLRRDGAPVTEVLVQPKRIALLAYLAATDRGGYTRRDLLLSLFWPDHDAERGRNALRQHVHGLRGALGDGAPRSRGQEELGLDPAGFACDVWEFTDALAAGETERAAEVYGGPFLRGFFVEGAAGFERWADERREELARGYVAAVETLGTAAAARGDHREGTRWWTLLLQADPYNTPAVIGLMKALAADGDRPNAVVVGERYAERLRQDLSADPSREFRRLLAQLRLASGPGVASGGEVPPRSVPPAAQEPAGPAAGNAAGADQRWESGADPTQVGPYRIIRRLAAGGMGVVYEAEQTVPVRRRVALKLIQEGLGSPEILTRFEAERQALAVMEHPNIAKVYDAGVARGNPYFVMEYVEGIPLTHYCDAHRLSVRERVQLFAAVCSAVQHAHQKGVIHRDLKPSNILVTEQAGAPAPKVIDFGIAKAMGVRLTDRTLATAHDVMIGTPAYMSPEQAEGSGLDVDTRTDIYSLGVVLYEVLVGRLPVDPGEIGLLPFIAQLVLRESVPPTPSDRVGARDGSALEFAALRRTVAGMLRRELKGDLDWIVMKALAPERERRYESADALALDLRRYLRDEPVQARPPSTWYRLRKFGKRNTAGVVGAAAALLILVGGVITTGVGMVRATRAEGEARIARVTAEREAQTATQVSGFLVGLFAFSDPTRARGGAVTVREVLDEGTARLGSQLQGQPDVQARLLFTMARAYLFLGHVAKAESLVTRSLALAESALGPDHLETVIALYGLSVVRYLVGDIVAAETLSVRGLAIAEGLRDSTVAGAVALLANTVGSVHQSRGRASQAEEAFERARTLLESLPDPDRPRVELADFTPRQRLLPVLSNLGVMYASQRRHDEALAAWDRARAVAEAGPEPDHFEVTHTLVNLAWERSNRGQHAAAEELTQRAIAIYSKSDELPGLWLGRALEVLGVIRMRQGRLSEADSLLKRAHRGTGTGSPLAWQGQVQLAAGRAAQAEALFRRALSLEVPGSPNAARTQGGLGQALLARHQYVAAWRAFDGARSTYAALRPARFPDDEAVAFYGLALASGYAGRSDSTDAYFRYALDLQEASYAEYPAIVVAREGLLRSLDAYAAYLRQDRRDPDARRLGDRATAIRAAIPAITR